VTSIADRPASSEYFSRCPDENQTLGINLALIVFPARAMAGHAGPILLGGKNAFFIADLLTMNEGPDRPVAHPDASFS
jgi:hypothetical protein